MRSNSEGSSRLLAVAPGIGVAAALIAPGFGPAGRAGGRRDQADRSSSTALAVIEQFAREAEADTAVGAGYARDMARAQQAEAGDGTATAVILAAAMVSRAMTALDAGADPVRLAGGIEAARDAVLAEVRGRATPVSAKTEIAAVASTASFVPGLGELVAEAFDKAGKDGVITVESASAPGLGLVTGEGMTVDAARTDPDLAGQESGDVILDEPIVLVTRDEIRDRAAIAPVANQTAAAGRPLVVFAVSVAADVPGSSSAGRIHNGTPNVAIGISVFADQREAVLGDIAAVTGATVVGGSGVGGSAAADDAALDSAGALGTARKMIVTPDRTLIIGGGGDRATVAPRVREIRDEIDRRDDYGDRERLQKRLAMLAGGSVTLEVGGATEAATARLADQAGRALSVARLALDHGLSAGGGAALADAERALGKFPRSMRGGRAGDDAAGARVVLDSLTAPMRQLAANAGVPGGAIDKSLRSRKDGIGFAPATGKTVPMRPQVVDALPVIVAAVTNATALTVRVLAG
jgi:chaperonin GroEL